ncbi:alpha/beta hydrolase [Proteiniborus sp. MB09-C3]|uniref:alpha/beta hydrolase n=1 Tax=Proteiniborus sp. MB09-C3 TaxID=3050072 RepID=UPI00255770BA|nr:alpha/beta hydrolase [Proteiniborus sp. MB09-C3]WIV11605.1 lysophospholipase [Proteiniborus sp. MB09-C3]
MHKEAYVKSYDGLELYSVKDVPEKAKGIVVVVHGFAEHLGRYEYLTKRLNDQGYGVYRFDNRGHGKTKGERGHIKKFEDFLYDADTIVEMAKEENNSLPIYMLGHSMGGFITASYGVKYRDKLKGQIFSGAATATSSQVKGIKGHMFKALNKIAPKIRIKNPISKTLCKNQDVVEDYLKDELNLKEATLNFYVEFLVKGVKWLNSHIDQYDYPCLILHGGDDKIVPKEASENFYSRIQSKDKKIILYEGLYHEIMNEKTRDQVMDDICIWLDANDKKAN